MSLFPSRVGGHTVDIVDQRPRGTLNVYECQQCDDAAPAPGAFYIRDCSGGETA